MPNDLDSNASEPDNGASSDPRARAERLGIDYGNLEDALQLLKYALAHSDQVEPRVVRAIRDADLRVKGENGLPAAQSGQPDAARPHISVSFAIAARDLAATMAPITAETLRNTDDAYGRSQGMLFGGLSVARVWSRKLWFWTLFVLAFIVGTEILEQMLINFYSGDDEQGSTDLLYKLRLVFLQLQPFAYGFLGACTFLLRSCNHFIAQRTFDKRRISEYYSRMILGLVAGGAILLFVEQIIDDGEVINISSKALAFLAGYNIDFLFKTLERVVEAILPKVGLESVRRARPQAARAGTVSLEELTRQLEEAKSPEAREAIQELLKKFST